MTHRAVAQSIARLAARQEGNITYEQLRAAGLEPWVIRQRREAGWLIQRHHNVWAVGHVPRSRTSRFWAAVLALGPLAVLSHRAAGALWRLLDTAVPTELIVPPATGKLDRDGLEVHRCVLLDEHVTRRDGLPVTTVLRTILDLAAVLDVRRLDRAFEQAQVLHHLSPEAVAVELVVRRGYRGTGRLRQVLRGGVDAAAVRSVLELRFLKLCADRGIERPLVNRKIGMWTPDFWWPGARVVVETDGWDFHRSVAARRRDALKEAELRALGLTVIRFTWRDVHERPARVALALRAALSDSSTSR